MRKIQKEMTRENAINNLKMIRLAFVEPVTKEQSELISDTFNMAIKALKQEPCDDAISRQAVIDLFEQIKDTFPKTYTAVEMSVRRLPPVYPQEPKAGHWIPVSERLPERSVWVLAYCKTKDGYEYQTVLLLAKYNGEWTDCDDFCDDVIAWMPLPEPYKAESEDKNE